MARLKLSERYVATMPPPAGHDRIDRDTEVRGLAVRITNSGSKTFLFCYSFDGKERRLPLGEWFPQAGTRLEGRDQHAKGSVNWARREVARMKTEVMAGRDPDTRKSDRAARDAVHQQAAREVTVEQLAVRYYNEHAKKKRSGHEDLRRLNAYVVPVWGRRHAKSITRADVDALVSPVAVDNPAAGTLARPAEAGNRLALVRKMFSFALDKGILDVHPCLRMKSPGGAPVARTRALTTARELRVLWGITEPGSVWTREPAKRRTSGRLRASRFTQAEADALRLVLLTGARASEVVELPWDELDLDAGTWLLPAARSKNKRANLLPLLPEAIDTLRRRRESVTGAYVFPAVRRPHMVDEHLSRPLKLVCARLGRLGIAPFTTHDLRRTVETGMAAAKVPKEYRDRVLNHVDSSVGGKHYNVHDYADEKLEALQAWHRRLETMLTGTVSNVVPLRRSALS